MVDHDTTFNSALCLKFSVIFRSKYREKYNQINIDVCTSILLSAYSYNGGAICLEYM